MKRYIDPITGYEIRQYTFGPERNAKLYFTSENFSPDDKFFYFNRRSAEGSRDGGCYRENVETGELERVTDETYRGFAMDRVNSIIKGKT